MATKEKIQETESAVDKALRPNFEAQKRIIQYARSVQDKNRDFQDLRNKMDAVDVAYARYKASLEGAADGVDVAAGNTGCDIFASDDVTPPIVVSQVDSFVSYLSEVFLSGQPLFPVVSTPSLRTYAEQMESIIDDHANIGGYARQLLMFIRDGCKYNFSAIEAEWTGMDQFTVADDVTAATGQSIKRKQKKMTRLKRLNPRNTVWDWSVMPGDVSLHGDYAGYIESVSRMKLKRELNKLVAEGKGFNIQKAMSSGATNVQPGSPNMYQDPTITDYAINNTGNRVRSAAPNWDLWFDPRSSNGRRGPPNVDAMYERFVLYARIMPADMGLQAPQPNTPQIWKFIIINNEHLVSAQRIISAFDLIPILFGQPLEDGLGYQTQSIAESEIPFQKAAATLFNIRFASARRAVSDRALYIPDMISPTDINTKVPAPKIPVNISALSNKSIQDAYHPIPFSAQGLETVIQDAQTIVGFSKELHGINSPRQGQFQKGNKSVQEWNDTMSGSDGRMRLPALCLEHQVFIPLKALISLNILQYGEDGEVVSHTTGRTFDVKIAELRKANLSFKVADGYTPKSKIASTEVLVTGMTMIMNSPILQMQFGPMLPSMFLHFMSLSGVKGMEQYDPRYIPEAERQQFQNMLANNPQMLAGTQPGTSPVVTGQPPLAPSADASTPVV